VSDRLSLVFAGTPEFSVAALEALHRAGHEIRAVYTQPDRPAGRGRVLAASPVKQRAIELGLAVEQPATLRTADAAARLAARSADLMVVVAYGLILPPQILQVPRLGCWNIHASLLPRWRGAAPIQRAILAGDTLTGVTIMQMDAGLDTGSVLLTRETSIDPRETGGSLHDRLSVTYAAKIHKEEARIDWSRPAVHIDRQVRAFDPWPVAETRWQERQLRIWEASVEPATAAAPPGTVIEAGAGRIVVATGDGALRLARVQLAGRRAMSAPEFLNAHALAGARLG
jgi:methionyl-tRNA formyltransferase